MSKLSERRREIHAMTMAQSQEELAQMRKHLFELRLQKERGEVKNNRQFAQVKQLRFKVLVSGAHSAIKRCFLHFSSFLLDNK